MTDEFSDFEQELENFLDLETPKKGEVRPGTVVSISPNGVHINIEKSNIDGIVPTDELDSLDDDEKEKLAIGSQVIVKILDVSADSVTLSIHKAHLSEDWKKAQEYLQSGELIEIEITGYNKGGLIAPFGEIRGFIPLSQAGGFNRSLGDRERQRKMAKMGGATLKASIIEVDPLKNKLVFSTIANYNEWKEGRESTFFDTASIGERKKGRIRSVQSFGVFVDLGDVDGLIHVSELAWHRIDNPKASFKKGDAIEAVVITIDKEKKQIGLSRRQCVPNPWDTITVRYAEGSLVEGTIARLVEFGAFVELEPGIEGLLHISQISTHDVSDVSDYISPGEVHLLRVQKIEEDRKRIRLSMKKVRPEEQIEWMQKKIEAETASTETKNIDPVVTDAQSAETPEEPEL